MQALPLKRRAVGPTWDEMHRTRLLVWLRRILAGCALIYFFAVCAAIFLSEALLAVTANWLFMGGALFAGLVGLALGAWAIPSRAWAFTAIVFVACGVVLPFLDLTPAKPFRRFYDQISTGMTVPEVQAVLNKHFAVKGRFKIPVEDLQESQIWYTLDPSDGNYDSEFIHVKLLSGRVSTKKYLAD